MPDVMKQTGAFEFLTAVLEGKPSKEVADASGVTVKTVNVRLNDPRWQAIINRHRLDALARVGARLSSNAGRYVDSMERLMESGNENVALGASKALMEYMVKLSPQGEVSTVNTNISGNVQVDVMTQTGQFLEAALNSPKAMDALWELQSDREVGKQPVPDPDADVPSPMPDVVLPDPE